MDSFRALWLALLVLKPCQELIDRRDGNAGVDANLGERALMQAAHQAVRATRRRSVELVR